MAEHSIGKMIAALRKTKGWTQVELAEKLNISDKAVSKWESEAGYPEITMFPRLADLFGVSIDYLMTGKEVQPEIITISKAEMCAKNDDITLLKEIDFLQKDESNKCLIDYIKQYESLNVFATLCAEDDKAKGAFDLLTFLKFCLLSNHIELLNKTSFWLKPRICSYRFDSPEEIMGLMPVGALEHFGNRQGNDQYVCVLPDDFFTMIATDKRINETTIDFLLGKQRGRKCVWYHAFPYLIDACYKVGNASLLDRLLTLSEENNQYAYENLNDKGNYHYNYFYIGIYGNNDHGLVRILDKTLQAALQKNDFEMIERMNNINRNVMAYHSTFKCGLVSDDEIRVARLKLDKSVSAQDIIIQSSIHNGIVIIDELLAVNDVDLIEKTLKAYPVSKYELLNTVLGKMRQAVESDDWRFIFEYAIDHDDDSLIYYVQNGDKEKIEKWISSKNKLPPFIGVPVEQFFAHYEKDNLNIKYFKLRNKGKFSGLVHSHEGLTWHEPKSGVVTIKTIDQLAEYLLLCKKQVVDDFKANHNADKIIEELSEEYFRKELDKGNIELVAIKLCVRLETVLKSKYHYEGDFSEMLEKYCSQYGVYEEDDGWGYIETRTHEFVTYLQKLRKYRNSIVGMNVEELNFCIDYICGLK